MVTLHIVRGIPACGKSTYAREWVAQAPDERARVNRDDIRQMLNSNVYVKGVTEGYVNTVRDATIAGLLRSGVDVISDDTNLRNKVVRGLVDIAREAGAEFEFVDMTDVDVNTCIARDAARENPVGEDVVRDFYMRYVRGQSYPLKYTEPVPETVDIVKYVPDTSLPRTILCDLDGTVALMGDRNPYDETKVMEDEPHQPVVDAVRAMHAAGHRVVFMSARTDGCKEDTAAWLDMHVGVEYDDLLMRKSGDERKDAIVKREIFDTYIRDRYHVVGVFDDRNQVVEMWRALGLTAFQVADGDF